MSAGLLGIGGGMIVNPLLLEFNIHPQAAAATSTLMVLFSSSSAALSFGFGQPAQPALCPHLRALLHGRLAGRRAAGAAHCQPLRQGEASFLSS